MKIYVILLLIFISTIQTKKTPPPPQHPYLMHLSLEFNEENITNFISESFFATNGWIVTDISYCPIKLYDVFNAIPFKKLTDESVHVAFGKLNVEIADDDVEDLIENLDYTQLSNMGFSVRKFFKNFEKAYFKNRTTDLPAVLKALGVGPEFAFAYAFGTEEEMFNAFKEGDYSAGALQELQTVINATITFKDIYNILGIKKIESEYLEEFINTNVTEFLSKKRLQKVNFELFLDSFNFTLNEYKNMKSFKTCYNALSKEKSLAVATTNFEITTNDDSLLNAYLNLNDYTTLSIRNIESELTYGMFSYSSPSPFVEITLNSPIPAFIEKTDTFTITCTYITEDAKKKIIAHNMTVYEIDGEIMIFKSLGIPFKKSSPLVCDGKLLGLASSEDLTTIKFDRFVTEIDGGFEVTETIEGESQEVTDNTIESQEQSNNQGGEEGEEEIEENNPNQEESQEGEENQTEEIVGNDENEVDVAVTPISPQDAQKEEMLKIIEALFMEFLKTVNLCDYINCSQLNDSNVIEENNTNESNVNEIEDINKTDNISVEENTEIIQDTNIITEEVITQQYDVEVSDEENVVTEQTNKLEQNEQEDTNIITEEVITQQYDEEVSEEENVVTEQSNKSDQNEQEEDTTGQIDKLDEIGQEEIVDKSDEIPNDQEENQSVNFVVPENNFIIPEEDNLSNESEITLGIVVADDTVSIDTA